MLQMLEERLQFCPIQPLVTGVNECYKNLLKCFPKAESIFASYCYCQVVLLNETFIIMFLTG